MFVVFNFPQVEVCFYLYKCWNLCQCWTVLSTKKKCWGDKLCINLPEMLSVVPVSLVLLIDIYWRASSDRHICMIRQHSGIRRVSSSCQQPCQLWGLLRTIFQDLYSMHFLAPRTKICSPLYDEIQVTLQIWNKFPGPLLFHVCLSIKHISYRVL